MQNIVDALAKNNQGANDVDFYATGFLNENDLHVDVLGVGKIDFPISKDIVEKLLKVCTKAKVGLREKTLLNTDIRDTYEITDDKLHVTYNNNVFDEMLDNMRAAMGLSEHAKLIPHLHNMLIYTPGQFFKEHKDSEKLDCMVASLVVVLPSPHIGGSLIIQHNGKSYAFTSENLDTRKLSCIAFYSDCQHLIKEVTHGYRIVLTYNLVLETIHDLDKHQNKALESALKEYFNLGDVVEVEDLKLAYFLDHSYTEHSLRWDILKGVDYHNASAFCIASKNLQLIPHLALIEVRESWSAYGDDEKPELEDLVDREVNFSYWIDINNNKLAYDNSYYIEYSKLCWTKETEDFEPYDSEYEGWRGNYGNTMDYWYRRAAIVLWPKVIDTAMKFKLSYDSSIEQLLRLTQQDGKESAIIEIIKQSGKYLFMNRRSKNNINFIAIIQLAIYIKNQDIAADILAHYSFIDLVGSDIEYIVKLQHAYGTPWTLSCMDKWRQNVASHQQPLAIIQDMYIVADRHLNLNGDLRLLEYMLLYQIDCVIAQDNQDLRKGPVAINSSLVARVKIIKNLLKGCSLIKDHQAISKLVHYLMENSYLYPFMDLAEIISPEVANIMAVTYQGLYTSLRKYIVAGIKEELVNGVPQPNDYSIKTKITCDCALCKIALEFVHSRTETTKIWPLAQQSRDHVMQVFSNLDLPIELSVKKEGSPHKLVLHKSKNLYQNAKNRFDNLLLIYEQIVTKG